jgi:hypothetical protein
VKRSFFQTAEMLAAQAGEDFLEPFIKMEGRGLRKLLSKLLRTIPILGLVFGSCGARAMAEQSTRQGKQSLQEYRDKVQQENRNPPKNTKTKPKKTGAHPQMLEEKKRDDAYDVRMSSRSKSMSKEQKERSAKDDRMERAERRNKDRRMRSDKQAAADDLKKNPPERKKEGSR